MKWKLPGNHWETTQGAAPATLHWGVGTAPGDYNDRERQQHTRQSAKCKCKYVKKGGLNVLNRLTSEESALGVVTGVEFLFFFCGVLEGPVQSDLVQP